MKGPHHDLTDLLRLAHFPHGLGHAPEELRIVNLLKGAAAALFTRHLPDEHDQRRGILLRHMDGDRTIRRAGAATDYETLRHACDLCLGQRHEPGASFVPAHDRLDAIGIMQCVEKCEVAFARNAIDA
jgi:hypothetical protein